MSVGALILGTGPRFARDAAGPVLAFYIGWKLVGLVAGVVVATTVAFMAFWWERRRARSGFWAAIGLGIALVQALAALSTGSAVAYFAPAVIVNGAWGLAFLVSIVLGRPLAGVFAREIYPFPPEVRASATFQRIFARISGVWCLYLLLRATIRGLVLLWRDVDLFVVISIVTGMPITLALMSWSIWYGVRSFRAEAMGGGPEPR